MVKISMSANSDTQEEGEFCGFSTGFIFNGEFCRLSITDFITIDDLPDEILVKILSYLDFSSLVKLSSVSKKYNRICNFDGFWRSLCEKTWLITDDIHDANANLNTPKEVFEYFYGLYGHYVNCYADVKSVWDRIVEFMHLKLPLIYDSLLPGVTEEDLNRFEEATKLELPGELRCLYRLCGGQRSEDAPSLFGCAFFSTEPGIPGDSFTGFIENYRQEASKNLSEYYLKNTRHKTGGLSVFSMRTLLRPEFQGLNQFLAVYLMKPSSASGTDDSDILDHVDSNNVHFTDLEYGSIVSCCLDQSMLDQLPPSPIFLFAASILDYLRKFAENLDQYPTQDGHLLRFEFNSEGSTGPFTITTRTAFIKELSGISFDEKNEAFDQQFFYMPAAFLKMNPSARRSDLCELQDIHWITSEDETCKQLFFPPEIDPDDLLRSGKSQLFYSFYCCQKSPMVTRGGHFLMENLTTGQPVRINWPDFVLKPPKLVFPFARTTNS